MSKQRTSFQCEQCGAISAKWSGQCGDCGEWNTFVEFNDVQNDKNAIPGLVKQTTVKRLADVSIQQITRIPSGSKEFDRVLGGGLVPASVVLLGGDPGIGKSTLLLQSTAQLSKTKSVLYVSGEESLQQIALRAGRLSVQDNELQVLAENGLEKILGLAVKSRPDVLVVDSIQTLFTETLTSAPGSVSQVRECAARLVRFAKQSGCIVILVGHVTKEGALAGPRILEHMVDSVLYFEGDTSNSFRLIRAFKNRFGAVNEIGVFSMTESGLKDVSNPSAMLVSRQGSHRAGSIVLASVEGTRPLLVEVQALVDESALSNPRRLCVGLEQNRLAMLLAVCHRHAGISLNGYDVFTNVAGGVKITETGSDLALLLAVVSSLRDQVPGKDMIVFGEVGLSGELRPVQRAQERINEAAKLGFTKAIIPSANRVTSAGENMEIISIAKLQEVFEHF